MPFRKHWTKETLIQFLKTGTAAGKTSVFGPMTTVVRESLSHLNDADISAMATYLLDSPPPDDMPAPQRFSPLTADTYKRALGALHRQLCGLPPAAWRGTSGVRAAARRQSLDHTGKSHTTSSPLCSGALLPADSTVPCQALPAVCPMARSPISSTSVRTSWGNRGVAQCKSQDGRGLAGYGGESPTSAPKRQPLLTARKKAVHLV